MRSVRSVGALLNSTWDRREAKQLGEIEGIVSRPDVYDQQQRIEGTGVESHHFNPWGATKIVWQLETYERRGRAGHDAKI